MPTGNELVRQIEQTTVIPNSLAIWGLGQMGFVVKGPDAIIYIDPCLSDSVPRAFPTPLEPERVTHATYVLSSHEHTDHLDPKTLGPIAKVAPQTKFVVTGWSLDKMADFDIADDRVIVPPALETITMEGTSLRLTALPAAHYGKDHDEQKGYRWLGYIIEWNGVTLYHSGDTIIYEGYIEMMESLPKADIALLAVNGRDYFRTHHDQLIGNLWPVEVARLTHRLGWDVVVPGHNDLMTRNTIPTHHIIEALERDAPGQKFKIFQPGELYYYVK